MNRNTYSLGIVLEWAIRKGLIYEYANARVGFNLTNHGIRLHLVNDYELSIQTHPDVAGWAFAETALVHQKKMVHLLYYKYDVLRWSTPEELFAHIEDMLQKVSDQELMENERLESVEESNEENSDD